MTDFWLPTARHCDYSGTKGYGPFGAGMFHGVIVHVNDVDADTSDAFYNSNANDVCPNFQVDRSGVIHQYLPLDWQSWTQMAGNSTYAAIETGGLASTGYTAAQVASVGAILREYHQRMGMPLVPVDTVGARGIGTHRMGGTAWGGHSCPGDIRANQRGALIKAAGGLTPSGGGTPVKPAPVAPHATLHRAWPSYMPAGHYFGDIAGPAASHGGYYPNEKPDVLAIQQRLQTLGYAPKVAGWADGIWNAPTTAACAAWQRARYAATTTLYGQCWSDDWAHLFTY